jgi:hypothetical protein
MTLARWQATHAYTAGTVILPTVDNGRCFYCATAGTSGSTEPTWPFRFSGSNPGGVTDGTAVWTPYTVITPQGLRDLMGWDTDTGNQQQPNHTDTVLGNYLLDAAEALEKPTKRLFVNRPGITWQYTSYGRPIIPLPGFRTITSAVWMGAAATAGTPGSGGSAGYITLPDVQQTGVYTSISFRPLRNPDAGPWWLSLGGPTTNWFDTGADLPFDPRNYGGSYVFTSVEGDTTITGDAGYEPGREPGAFIHALAVQAGWYAMRPLAILADSVITPQGGVISYAAMPPEVRAFIADWSTGQTVVSLG